MKKKAFTLIELIAVLVILAILALIVTPLVMNIIRKAKNAADRRSIDAYGRSIELAIVSYLLDESKFPTRIEDLKIEYSGDEVVCSVSQLNDDSSVYLSGCTVAGRSVDYVYGSNKSASYQAYNVGDEVTYNNVDYYVIEESGTSNETITLLKKNPLSVEEVNTYGGVGTANNHVNKYVFSDVPYYQTAYDMNGYGGMAYYTSETCGTVNENYVNTGCTPDYLQSEVKYVVDSWKNAKAPLAIEARLISKEEIETERKEYDCCGGCGACIATGDFAKYDWMYNNNYSYWTSNQYSDSSFDILRVSNNGELKSGDLNSGMSAVRPVITIKKTALN